MAFKLFSPAWVSGGDIPRIYTCDGPNESPPLEWTESPPDVKSFALIMDDPDAPGGTFTHWLLVDIPAQRRDIPYAFRVGTFGVSGRNDFGQLGYGGPCPPPGPPHRYFFRLSALDVLTLGVKEGVSRRVIDKAMGTHIIGLAEYMGRYARHR